MKYIFKFTAESNNLYGKILAKVYDEDGNLVETFEGCSVISNMWKPARDRLIKLFGVHITHSYYYHMLTDFLKFYGKYCANECLEIVILENDNLIEQDIQKLTLLPKMALSQFKINTFLLNCIYNGLTTIDKYKNPSAIY